MKNSFQKGLETVFKENSYTVISLLIAVLFFSISVLSRNLQTLFQTLGDFTAKEYFFFFGGLYYGGILNTPVHSLIMLIIISILLGIMVSLITFKIRALGTLSLNKSGFVGTITGIIAPVCAPCGIGLLSFIGLGSVLIYLPFQGAEIGLLSIGLLVYSIYSLSTSIAGSKACKVK